VTAPIDFYDRHAGRYDQPVHQRFYQRVAADLIHRIPVEIEIGSILEVGAGTGFATLELRKRYPRARMVCLEPSAQMLDRAVAKNIPRVDWRCCRLGQLEPAPFDLVFSSMAYHWLDETERKKLAALAKSKILAIALPIIDMEAYSNGNLALKQLLYRLKAKPAWQKDTRRNDRAADSLRARFECLSAHRSDLKEEFDSAGQMAEVLYERGVLPALFGQRAAEARERLPSVCDRTGPLRFTWPLSLMVAQSNS
jgi:trans-aconitate methyltransferase